MKYNTIFMYDEYTYDMYNYNIMIRYRNFHYHFVRRRFKELARLLARWYAKLKHWHAV